jgi:hypothetical protein
VKAPTAAGACRGQTGLPLAIFLMMILGDCRGRVTFDENGCDDDGECGISSLHCDVANATCVECVSDAQCTAQGRGRDRCDTAAYTCVECGLDSDCGQGRVCRHRHCVTLCASEGPSSSCPTSAPYCEDDDDDGFCVQCGDDLPQRCASGNAAGPICTRTGACVECQADRDCKAPSPRCETFSGRCVACLKSKDCTGSASLCDPTVNRCVPPRSG